MIDNPVMGLGEMGLYAADLARVAPKPPRCGDRFWVAWSRTLSASLIPVIAVTGPFGMVTALQGVKILRVFGTERLLSSVVGLAVLRELAPVLSSMMIAAQSGSGAAAEIATLKVTQQWDALEVMSTPARKWVTLPRVAAIALAAPILSILGALAGILGGYFVEVVLMGFPRGIFFAQLTGFLSVWDVAGGLLKATVFGLIAGVFAGYHGERATGGARGVGLATNRAVVSAVAAILIANYLLSSLLFGRS
ncbi:MAG: ABC transporter permease [Acidobacteriota bacterium]